MKNPCASAPVTTRTHSQRRALTLAAARLYHLYLPATIPSSLFRLTLLSATVLALCSNSTSARAAAIGFNDSDPTNVASSYDSFNSFQYDGNASVQHVTYDFTKGQDLNFSGTYTTSGNVTNLSTYIYVTMANPTVPCAELTLNLSTSNGNVGTLSGTFIGYTDPNLPSTIPTGATVETATLTTGSNPSYQNAFFIGNLGIYTTLDSRAVPEPSTWALVGGIAGLLGLARCRRWT